MAKNLLDRIAKMADITPDARACGCCVSCGKAADSFRDARSKREYQITGFCQECQDRQEQWYRDNSK